MYSMVNKNRVMKVFFFIYLVNYDINDLFRLANS